MPFALDLTQHHFRRDLGDLTIYGTWFGETPEEREPCLCLVPRYRRAKYPVVIALSSAYRYDNPSYMLKASMEIVKALEMTDDMATVHRVASTINDHLLDLIKMPPKPVTVDRSTGAELIVTSANGQKQHFEAYEER